MTAPQQLSTGETACGRALLCHRVLEQGRKVQAASEAAAISARTAYKWLERFRLEGPTGQRRHRNRGNGWDAVHLAIGDHSRVYLEFDKVAVTLSAEGASFSGTCSTLAILETAE